ncbi:polysaccharide deacetylase family protein [Shewanella sp. A32]|uniref:polysaccharide deacetylase family protein n=1 Tax=Shewanella sp. A32 TaxID=3031327 RepID=UPI0023B99AD5|nr:polysaccharide deacetylase family protein [Shewanella sp. A32]MDF0535417.1 polysaccharide deacetylase family protein [Shewanella sp. A32]
MTPRYRMAKVAKWLLISALILLVVIAALFLVSRSRNYQLFGDLVSHVDTDKPLVALTFDDGPSKRYTAEILAVLHQYQVHATFFVTGREASRHSAEAHAIVDAGHDLGNHSWSHSRMLLRSPSFIATEIELTDAVIRQAGYSGDIYFRPPYGKKLFLLPWYLASHHRTTVTWSMEPDSDLNADAHTIAQKVLAEVTPGSIILLHVMYASRDASRGALPLIIEGLQGKGYQLVTLSQLLMSAQ